MNIIAIPFSIIAEWMCFLASILLLKTVPIKFWKWFSPYLAAIAVLETYCYYVKHTSIHRVDNQWLYNYAFILCIIFHLYIFSKVINTISAKKICLICVLILIGVYGFDFSIQGISNYFYTTNTTLNGIIIMLSLVYYYSLFKQDEFKDILVEPEFWFVTGCLIYFTTSTGVIALHKQILAQSEINQFPIRYVILNFLNLIMYGCWIKSFLCLKKNQVYSQ